MSARQQHWLDAARTSDDLAAGLFLLIALPNANEGGHSCSEHAIGFSRDGRRGFRCGVCRNVVRWIDPNQNPPNPLQS
jgi:hypothetical protein